MVGVQEFGRQKSLSCGKNSHGNLKTNMQNALEHVAHAIHALPVWQPAVCWGLIIAFVSRWHVRRSLQACDLPSQRDGILWGMAAGLLSSLLTVALWTWHVQEVPEVRPDIFWWIFRPVFLSGLIVLLVSATATDIRTHYILDSATVPGMLIALGLATLSGDLQMCHLWVDWNQVVPQLSGPYIPEWIKLHPHWHGFAWSSAGLCAGGGLTWLARVLSSWILGQQALGFGDVTLMAMIGAFLGWQPVLFVFLLAPLCALTAGLLVRLFSKRTYLPYGPYLSLAALLVMFSWRRIWMLEIPLTAGSDDRTGVGTFAIRELMGDPIGLAFLFGLLFGGLTLLLGALRLYWSIPVSSADQENSTPSQETKTPAEP